MKTRIGLIFFLLITFQQLQAQQHDLAKAVIPFSFIENKSIFIQVTIKGKPFTFYFDTGATGVLLNENSAKELGINANSETNVTSTGGDLKYKVALNQKIKVQELEIDSVSLILDDLSRLRKSMGYKFDGIIGSDILKKYITEIDFDKQIMYLYPFTAKLNLNKYIENSFVFAGDDIPVLNTTIQLNNGQQYSGKVLFDCGARLALFVNTPFKEENNLIGKGDKIFSSSSENLSNSSKTQYMAIDKIAFAGNSFSKLPIMLSSSKIGVSSDPNYLGILGNEIINRFNYILNYQTKKLYLKRNSLYDMAFDYPTSGLKLLENEVGEYYIAKIFEESELYKKGVRENDILISIDGVSEGSIAYFKKLLNQENKEMTIKIKQKSSIIEFKVTLKKLI